MTTLAVPVWVDKAFTKNERADIHRALEDWQTVLGPYVKITVESDDYSILDFLPVEQSIQNTSQGLVIHRTQVGSDEEKEVNPNGNGVLGWLDDMGGHEIYIVSDRVGLWNLHTIVLHELGHFFGAGHTEVPGSLMYPTARRQVDCVDQLTAMSVAGAHTGAGWYWRAMSYCPTP